MVRHTPVESKKPEPIVQSPKFHASLAKASMPQAPVSQAAKPQGVMPQATTSQGFKLEPDVHLWVDEQIFEEDVRAVLRMMRPNGRERLQGWKEYRTGGAHFRVTVSWDDEFQITSTDTTLAVPHMTEVLETLLVGSARGQDEMDASQEFEQYRSVVRDLYQRLDQREACYE